MIALSGDLKIWLCTQPTDMRRSFDGLSAQVKQVLNQGKIIKITGCTTPYL